MTDAERMEILRISTMQPQMKWHREKSRNPPHRFGDSSRAPDGSPSSGVWGLYQYRCGKFCIVPSPKTFDYDLYFDGEIVGVGYRNIEFAKDGAKPYAFGVLTGNNGDPSHCDKYKELKYSQDWLAMYVSGYEQGKRTRVFPFRPASAVRSFSQPLQVGDGGQFGNRTPRIVTIYSDTKMQLELGIHGHFILDGYSTKNFADNQRIYIPGEVDVSHTESIDGQTFVVVRPMGKAAELKRV